MDDYDEEADDYQAEAEAEEELEEEEEEEEEVGFLGSYSSSFGKSLNRYNCRGQLSHVTLAKTNPAFPSRKSALSPTLSPLLRLCLTH